MAVLFAHMSEPPPLSARRPGLAAAADQVLARALAKVPEKRYGSCREFAGALRDALAEEAVRGRDTVVVSGEGAAAPVRSDWVEGETIDAPVLRAALAFGPGATTLAVGSEAGGASAGSAGDSTYLWDAATRKATATLADPASEDVMSVAFGPGGTTLAAADANGRAYLWQVATGKVAATFSRDTGGSVNTVAFGPGGTTLATGNADGSVDLWRIGTST
jgi:WD40 repeat protein